DPKTDHSQLPSTVPALAHQLNEPVPAKSPVLGLAIQFLPLNRTTHAGLDGPFILLETPDHQHLAYAETQRGSHWISDPDEVSILARKYAMLRSQALTPEDSRDLLNRLLGEQ
ncbi:Scr1 family TA system antitoxin-like transcriptional regulator, partial [Streptomyces sp. NPDC096310]|uniref:Scr1 family TA system antitoxin-like transcriptional regulator n=1 Tax=Streptomyces sp. NPDC096310 TaxID=3366082 RepID=UPI00382A8611